jgi:hypothetical protein
MITKQKLQAIRPEVNQALLDLGKKYGLSIQLGTGHFTSTNATFKLEMSVVTDTGVVIKREMQDLQLWAPRYGITPDVIKNTFRVGADEFVLVGFMPRRYKMPFLAKNVRTGIIFKLTSRQVQNGLFGKSL